MHGFHGFLNVFIFTFLKPVQSRELNYNFPHNFTKRDNRERIQILLCLEVSQLLVILYW